VTARLIVAPLGTPWDIENRSGAGVLPDSRRLPAIWLWMAMLRRATIPSVPLELPQRKTDQ